MNPNETNEARDSRSSEEVQIDELSLNGFISELRAMEGDQVAALLRCEPTQWTASLGGGLGPIEEEEPGEVWWIPIGYPDPASGRLSDENGFRVYESDVLDVCRINETFHVGLIDGEIELTRRAKAIG